MSLQNCYECGRSVSSAAAACPGCGAPVSTSATVTIQKTSKKLKMHQVLSALTVLTGGFSVVLGMIMVHDEFLQGLLVLGGLSAILIGGVWHVATKLRFWWHHS